MRIGMDISIQTCRDEGYMVMDYPVWKFKKNPRSTNCEFTRSLPSYMRDGCIGEKIIDMTAFLNYDDLWEMYEDNKAGIDSTVGFERYWEQKPDPRELLNLASDIDIYCGL